MRVASDFKGIGGWLVTCTAIGLISGLAVGYMLKNLGLAFACGSLGFLLVSRMIEWPFDSIIGLPSVEAIKNAEGEVVLTVREQYVVRELEIDRRVYRFFQASIYIREARDTITNGRNRELVSILLGLVILMFAVGFAVLSPSTAASGTTVPGGSAAATMSGETAWKVMTGLFPLFVHAVTLWIPLILQQARHQKL